MLIYITVHKDFSHPSVEQDTFQLDVESTISIEDIKVPNTYKGEGSYNFKIYRFGSRRL